ncbi:prepilin peptidase, partial [Ralstonia pseudosolanacearum]|uniref:prepilin peptidase n=1 Tax=Ralstonia pseudosolanacearum TaxID=1310165 RepID=UPI003CE98C54
AIFLLVLMTVTDFEQYMLFDAMTLPLALLGGFYVWQMNLNFQAHIAAALIGGGIFLLLAVLSKGSLGGGDVKLIAALGLW